MTITFRPLLAATYEHGVHTLQYPILGSPKLDGIRCLIRSGLAVSRNLKPIRNAYIQSVIGDRKYEGLDGELIVGDAYGPLVYNRTNSGVMSGDGVPDFKFYVFDRCDMPKSDYLERLAAIDLDDEDPHVEILPQGELINHAEMNAFEISALDQGYEGIMLRSMSGKYKWGRSTPGEGILWKVKRFEDYEARVIAIAPGMSNNNPALVDHLGHTIRSKHQENMSESGMVGALLCYRIHVDGTANGDPFKVAPGTMTHDQRRTFLQHPDLILGRVVKCKEFAYGKVDQPRFARFHGFRDPIDN